AIADPYVVAPLHVLERRPLLEEAAQNAAHARPLHEDVDAAVGIREQEDARRVQARARDQADDALWRHHGHPGLDAVDLTFVEGQALEPHARIAGRDRGGDGARRELALEREQAL